MAINVKIRVAENPLVGQKVASAQVVNLQQMDFAEFCDYLAQDSTVGAADVAAVMTQLEKKLPLLVGLGTKVQISQEGMTVKPTVSGSLTQEALNKKTGTTRELTASDLAVSDLTAGVSIDFSKKFKAAFAQSATLKRSNTGVAETASDSSADDSNVGEE